MDPKYRKLALGRLFIIGGSAMAKMVVRFNVNFLTLFLLFSVTNSVYGIYVHDCKATNSSKHDYLIVDKHGQV